MSQFLANGYEVLSEVISSNWRDRLIAELPKISNSGSRKLLDHQIFQNTVEYIRNHPRLSQPLSQLVAIQCTFFRKSKSHNWSISLHQDTIIPVQGKGEWHDAGFKEGIHFVRPPENFLDRCICLRVNLDDASEGDLYIIPNSHLHLDKTVPQRENAKLIEVSCNGGLVMKPTTIHGSSKLKKTKSRRVLHYVFAPLILPLNYQWYYAI